MKLITTITCNNEHIYLKYLLPIVETFSDEIVVVNDNEDKETRRIVESNRGKFLIFPLGKDCSEKRNYAFNQCENGTWLLRIDTDEMPTIDFARDIRGVIREVESEVDRFMVKIFHLVSPGACKEEVGIELRLLNKNETCKYYGNTHEGISGKFPKVIAFLPIKYSFVHFKYMDNQKVQANLESIAKGEKFYDKEDFKRRLDLKTSPLPDAIKYPFASELKEYLGI